MWHVSTAPLGPPLSRALLEKQAYQLLAGHGDPALGEWSDWTGRAFHLRRRLTPAEAAPVGPVRDIRGTPEARRRASGLGRRLALVPAETWAAEVGTASHPHP